MEKIKEGQTVKFPKMKQTLVVAKILSEQYLEDYADIEPIRPVSSLQERLPQ